MPASIATPPSLAGLSGDIVGHHGALYVDDIEKAAACLKSKNVRTLQGPIPINEGPAAVQSILYFVAPMGLQLGGSAQLRVDLGKRLGIRPRG